MSRFFLFLIFTIPVFTFSQEKTMTSQEIASKHFNSIVKILLVDSIQEKHKAGSGYFGRGSGFFVSEDGIIFTNKHVAELGLGMVNYSYYNYEQNSIITETKIYNPQIFNLDLYKINYISKMTIIVQVFERANENISSLYLAKLISVDTTNYDGAILKIVSKLNGDKVTKSFNPIIFGNSNTTQQGEDLCVYGFPETYSGNLDIMLNDQSTILSGKHAGFDWAVNKEYGHIKTDIQISSGNSGGPVFNKYGLVVGIATASSVKTGNGFISKINGMTNLAKGDFLLFNALKSKGLVSHNTQNTITTTGIVNNPSYNLPNWQRINKFNLDQKYTRQFYGGLWYVKAGFTILNNDNYKINKSESTFYTTSVSDKLIKNKPSFFFELGKHFSLSNMSTFHKFSLDLSFVNVGISSKDWSGSELITDSINSTITYNSAQSQMRIGSKIGLCYSMQVKNRTQIDIYYKFGFSKLMKSAEIGSYEPDSKKNEKWAKQDITQTEMNLVSTFGVNFHVYGLILGAEYIFGGSDVVYNGFLDKPNLDNTREIKTINGQSVISHLNFTLGVPIYNKKRWKKFS